MKFNNKLNLVEYLQVIDEIVNEYFDANTSEYTPQIGDIYSVCAYFNHCVELEETDEIKIHPIEDIMDMEQLYSNDEFIKHYNKEIYNNMFEAGLTFGNAYSKAIEIVEYKKNDANAFAIAISAGINAILKGFRNSFSDDDINRFIKIAQQVNTGKLSGESIVNAYSNSDRFKENTDELNKDNKKIVEFPVDK